MSLIAIIRSVCEIARRSLREQADSEFFLWNDHTLADLGLRRADLRAGLWQPTGKVDGDPPVSPRLLDPKDFGADWWLF